MENKDPSRIACTRDKWIPGPMELLRPQGQGYRICENCGQRVANEIFYTHCDTRSETMGRVNSTVLGMGMQGRRGGSGGTKDEGPQNSLYIPLLISY